MWLELDVDRKSYKSGREIIEHKKKLMKKDLKWSETRIINSTFGQMKNIISISPRILDQLKTCHEICLFLFLFCMQHFQAWTQLISVIWVRAPIVKLPFLHHCFHHISLLLVPLVQDHAYRIQKCQVKWGHHFIWLNVYKLHDLYYFMKDNLTI